MGTPVGVTAQSHRHCRTGAWGDQDVPRHGRRVSRDQTRAPLVVPAPQFSSLPHLVLSLLLVQGQMARSWLRVWEDRKEEAVWWMTGVPCTQCFCRCFSQLCGYWTPARAEKAQPWLGEVPCLLHSLGGHSPKFPPRATPYRAPPAPATCTPQQQD